MENNMPRKHSTVIIALLLLTAFGVAQELPDAPGVTVGVFPPNGLANRSNVSKSSILRGAPPAGKGPWIDPTIADANYWHSTAALFGSTIINVEMTARCSEEHTCLTQISPGSARAKLYLYTLPADVGLSYLAYRLKGRGSHWWSVPQVVFTAANLFSAGRSYGRVQ
jgi:hypothetical protein